VTDDVEYADEEQTGQLALGVPGEQRAFAGLAKEGKPAPIAPDRAPEMADHLRDMRDDEEAWAREQGVDV
jgi:hypothetical protein